MRLWKNSLPLRLAVITGTVFITVLFTALIAAYVTTDYLLKSGVDSALTSLARSTADGWSTKDGSQELPIGKDEEHRTYIQVVDRQGTLVYASNQEVLPVEGNLLQKALHGEEIFTDVVGHNGHFAVSTLPDWARPF